MRAISVNALALVASGYGMFAPAEPGVLEQLRGDVARLEAEIVCTEAANQTRAKNLPEHLSSMVDGLTASVDSLPARVEARVMQKCTAATERQCDTRARRVVVIGDKMLLGETP